MNTFTSRFDQLYRESGLSQENFGLKFGATKPQVFYWRNGKGEPSTSMLINIADACNVSVDWLIGYSDIRTPIATIAAHRANDATLDLPIEAQQAIERFKDEMRKIYGKK